MTFGTFRNALYSFEVFSVTDIIKLFPAFDTRRLVEWQRKGYIQKLVNRWYLFSDIPMDDTLRNRISNLLYRPSYISLESALAYYNLIPEAVFTIQSVSTRKTMTYDTPIGSFHYRTLKPPLFFGYRVDRNSRRLASTTEVMGGPVLMADPEKTILDYLYLGSHLNSIEDLEGIRLNIHVFNELIRWETLEQYASLFESAVLNKRIRLLQKLTSHAHTS
jgi:predicted transcriptional regulator of viral defense system